MYGWPLRMLSELDKRYTGADYTVDKNSKDTIKPEQIKPLKGQAHHMFSRILKLLIFDFFTKFSFTCLSAEYLLQTDWCAVTFK